MSVQEQPAAIYTADISQQDSATANNTILWRLAVALGIAKRGQGTVTVDENEILAEAERRLSKTREKTIAQQVLDVELPDNDNGATTIRGFLVALAGRIWNEGEEFSGKRPFGNSDWDWDLVAPLVEAGFLTDVDFDDEEGYIVRFDEAAYKTLIHDAITELSKEPRA